MPIVTGFIHLKEMSFLFKDVLNTLHFTVIWRGIFIVKFNFKILSTSTNCCFIKIINKPKLLIRLQLLYAIGFHSSIPN